MTWIYLGRDSGMGEIYEIFRVNADKSLSFAKRIQHIQHLTRTGKWVEGDAACKGVCNEYATGWFNEDNEISEEQVKTYVKEWNNSGWPGN